MDGHFVPNITFGPPVVAALRPHTDEVVRLSSDDQAAAIPISRRSPRRVATSSPCMPRRRQHLDRSLQAIRGLGKKAGVALNPATPAKRDRICARPRRSDAGHDGQSRLRRAGVHSRDRREDRAGQAHDRRARDRHRGRRRRDAGDGAAGRRAPARTWLVAGSAVFKGGPGAYAGNIAAIRASVTGAASRAA